MRIVLWLIYMAVMVMPAFFINPISENITGLQAICPVLYYVWSVSLIAALYRYAPKKNALFYASMAFLVIACITPYSASQAGWINDIHIWFQVIGITLYSILFIDRLPYSLPHFFIVLGTSFALMCLSGQVSGLCEIWFGLGIGLLNMKKTAA